MCGSMLAVARQISHMYLALSSLSWLALSVFVFVRQQAVPRSLLQFGDTCNTLQCFATALLVTYSLSPSVSVYGFCSSKQLHVHQGLTVFRAALCTLASLEQRAWAQAPLLA